MKHIYKFSIVTAVYNTAEYLDEMIESVINQDIDFEKNVQLILVDDGSKDNSVSICEKYKEIYPNNIEVICLNHSGVSIARNKGIELAKGEYINFLDSDDKLENNALSEVWKFFKTHENEIDLVAIPLYFFEAEQGEHLLNYKFTFNRIINIKEEYKAIQLSSSSTFIKQSVLNNYKFIKQLQYAEDAKLVTEIICNKMKYGVVNTTKYWYRRRKNYSSAIQESKNSMIWYKNYINYFSKEVIKLSNYRRGNRRYLEYLIMYDLQWKINDYKKNSKLIESDEKILFINELKSILKEISISIIFEQTNLRLHRKLILLGIKFNLLKFII